ncbi:hypothetical protein AVDCRST_MAG84-2630 [uncultured Microcoleus sp.]|uniref:Uncharacterized protein n=1 Tax=uncultured Microcoleus sp. TaxID=259945 RepID=A0A6J4LZW7_9CYAN|nr:hypothetical protein AVDCRST_MAG84-2630 [uncultured Microcoleus sp.]
MRAAISWEMATIRNMLKTGCFQADDFGVARSSNRESS